MFEFSFKVKETSKRGRLLKVLLTDNSVEFADTPIPLSNTCSKCSNDVSNNEIIECATCKDKYHIPCLTHTIPTDFLALQSTSLCMWWFCTNCVAKSEATYKPEDDTTNGNVEGDTTSEEAKSGESDQVVLMRLITDKLSSFKTEVQNEILSMNKSFDEKLANYIIKQTDNADHSCDIISTVTSAIDNKLSTLTCNEQAVPSSNITWSVKASKHTNQLKVSQQQPTPAPSMDNSIRGSSEVLVLSPNREAVDSFTVNKLTKTVKSTLTKVPVNYVDSNMKTGKIYIGFPDSATREKGTEAIKACDQIESLGYSSKLGLKMLPKITVGGVPEDFFHVIDNCPSREDRRVAEKKLVYDSIRDKNYVLNDLIQKGHTMEVVFISKSKSGKYTLGLKVSPVIRATIFDKHHCSIYLGSGRYQVSDRFHFRQCYHCQLLGHVSTDCTVQNPVCFYCMGEHKSASCNDCVKKDTNKHCCAKCYASTLASDKRGYRSHNSASPDCPVLARELNRLASLTDFH